MTAETDEELRNRVHREIWEARNGTTMIKEDLIQRLRAKATYWKSTVEAKDVDGDYPEGMVTIRMSAKIVAETAQALSEVADYLEKMT